MTGFLPGINLPVFLGAYNHDLAPNQRYPGWGYEFSPLLVFRYLATCRVLGFRVVRIWLCENGEGILTGDRGEITGVMPELLRSVGCIQAGARAAGLKLYWSFLDANAWRRNDDRLVAAIASQPDETDRFTRQVVEPVAERLDPSTTFAVEIFNEPENLSDQVEEGGTPWEEIARSIRRIRSALHEALPGVPVTSGTEPAYLPGLFGRGPPVDAVDLHFYHPDGGLPARSDLPVDIGDLPLWAGECGLSHEGVPGSNHYLLHYLHNARKLGYRAAFLWKLEGDDHLVRRNEENLHQPGFLEPTGLGNEVRQLLCTEWGGGA